MSKPKVVPFGLLKGTETTVTAPKYASLPNCRSLKNSIRQVSTL